MKVSAFNIQSFKVDGGAMFGVVPKVLWNKKYPSDENNLIPLDLKSLVIETENRVVWSDNVSNISNPFLLTMDAYLLGTLLAIKYRLLSLANCINGL